MFVDIAMSIYIDIQSFAFFSSSSLLYWEIRWTCAHNFWLILSVFLFLLPFYILCHIENWTVAFELQRLLKLVCIRVLTSSFLLIKSIDDDDDDRLKKWLTYTIYWTSYASYSDRSDDECVCVCMPKLFHQLIYEQMNMKEKVCESYWSGYSLITNLSAWYHASLVQ